MKMSSTDYSNMKQTAEQLRQEEPQQDGSNSGGDPGLHLNNLLPARQPQEGSPMNTYTESELDELRKSLPSIGDKRVIRNLERRRSSIGDVDIQNMDWKQNVMPAAEPDWYGAPRARSPDLAREFREKVRLGIFTGPTNGVCPGFLQCNMVVLRNGQEAFDFMLFCQRNKKACPLIEVCDVGSACPTGIAPGADLRTDIPRYCVYRDGVLEKEVTDVTEIWPEDSVAFLIGCSFSFDGALIEGGIPLRSVEQNKCVPMYKTNLKCRPSGSLKGNMVVSMKPVKAMDVSKAVEITAKYPHAHGSPVCVGCPEAIGINDVTKPDYGDPVDIKPDEVPVFHACGVTPQNIITESKVPFAITHSPGHMFVADLPSDTTF